MLSKSYHLTKEDLKAWSINLLKFTAPMFAVFFLQLANGVEPQQAWPVALVALYGALANLFSKWSTETVYKQ
jgi:hypothetical protein